MGDSRAPVSDVAKLTQPCLCPRSGVIAAALGSALKLIHTSWAFVRGHHQPYNRGERFGSHPCNVSLSTCPY